MRVIIACFAVFGGRVGLGCILGINNTFSITITIRSLHLHLVLSNFAQLLVLLRTRFVATPLVYPIVALGDICLHEVQDGLWL